MKKARKEHTEKISQDCTRIGREVPLCVVDQPGGPDSICARAWDSTQQMLDYAVRTGCRNYCVSDRVDIHSEVRTSELMINRPQEFLDQPVSAILGTRPGHTGGGLDDWSRSFSAIREKDPLLNDLQSWLASWLKSSSAQSDILLMADELITNALFNAPFVNKTTFDNPGIDRTDREVKMPGGFQGQIMVGRDDDRVVVACRDPFGSLNVEKYLNRLLKCESSGFASSINTTGKGGAGVGNCLVFNVCSSLYIGVRDSATTVVAASFFWKWSGKKRAQSFKGLHFFEMGR